MKKIYFLLIFILAASLPRLGAQSLEDYQMAVLENEAYTSIVPTGTELTACHGDDEYGSLLLPFAFRFGNTQLAAGATLYACSNGYLTVGAGVDAYAPSWSSSYGIISPLAHDLNIVGDWVTANTGVWYEVSGASPDRVLTVEWCDVPNYGEDNRYNFQVKLHEGTNLIEFCYGSMLVSSTESVEVGLRNVDEGVNLFVVPGLTPAWNGAVTAESALVQSMTVSSTYHPVNLTYRFTPVAVTCQRPVNLLADVSAEGDITFSWSDTAGGTIWEAACVTGNEDPENSAYLTTVTDTFVQFTGLSLLSIYKLYVRTVCDGEVSGWRSIKVATPCGAITDLPYRMSFDDEGAGSSVFPHCWSKLNPTTSSYPYVYNLSLAPSAPAVLRFYSTTSTYNVAVLPPVDNNVNINELQLTFKYYHTGSSYGSVGVMTDPADVSTFQEIASLPTATSTWNDVEVVFGDYADTGRYIAIRHVGTGSNYVDDVVLDYIPNCSPVAGLTVSAITGNGAFVSWSPGTLGTPVSYIVEYAELGTEAWVTQTVYEPYFMLSGLMPESSYAVRVYASCESGDLSDVATSTFATTAEAPCYKAVGDGTSSSYEFPLNNFYNYSYTQQLFRAEELAGLTEINGVGFDFRHTSNMVEKPNVLVYLGHTTLSAFPSEGAPVAPSALTLVYQGMLNCHTGWNYFPFDSAFVYDGTSSLVLAVLDNSGSYDGSAYKFSTHQGGSNVSLCYYSDDTQVSMLNPLGNADVYYSMGGERSNVRFLTTGCTCPSPTPVVAAVTSRTATVLWSAGGNESEWEVEYTLASDPQWVSLGTFTDMALTIDTLQPATSYMFRVRAVCGTDDHSDWQSVTLTTDCEPMTIPYAEMFDTYGTGSGAYPSCWSRLKTYSSNYPQIQGGSTSSNVVSAPGALTFYSTTATYEMAVMPELDELYDLTNLSVRFKLKQSTLDHPLIVGVLSDPMQASTFVPVDTLLAIAAGSFQEFVVPFADYAGEGRYIAFLYSGNHYIYMDNLELYDASCVAPDSLWAEEVAGSSLTLAWNASDEAVAWNVQYGMHGFALGAGTTTEAYSTTMEISDLPTNATLDFYVQSDCGGVQSPWAGPLTVTLVCGEIAGLPLVENFDTYGTGNATAAILPTCWERGGTGNYANYPYITNNTPFSTPGVLCFNDNAANYSQVVLPAISGDYPLNTLKVSFKYRTAATGFRLLAGVMEDSVFVPVDTVTFFAEGWNDYEVYFANYEGSGQRIAFRGVSGLGYMDNLTVSEADGCSLPLQVQALSLGGDSVRVSWIDNSLATQWVVEYGPHGFVPGNGTEEPANEHTAVITGLVANEIYDFYVRTDCASGDAVYAGPATVVQGAWLMANGADTLHTCNTYILDDGGYSGSYSGDMEATLVVYADAPGNALMLSGTVNTEEEYDQLYIYDGAGTGGTLLGVYSASAMVQDLIAVSGAATLHFVSDGSVSYAGFMIHVTCVPTLCDPPAGLHLAEVTSSATTVGWTGNAASYALVYGPQYFNPNAGGTTVNGIVDTFYAFTGLTPGAMYDVYVMAECDGGGNSLMCGPLTFAAGAVTVPVSGTQTITSCGVMVYDDGGATGSYSNNANGMLVVYPEPGSAVTISGTVNTESGYDFLYVYDGVGIGGTLLGSFSGTAVTVPLLTSTSGPITLNFVSDFSSVGSGFVLTTGCVNLACPMPTGLAVAVDNTLHSATITWTPGGSENEWVVGYKQNYETVWTEATVNTTTYTIAGLPESAVYDVRVKAVCGAGDESPYAETSFNTACGTISAFPFVEGFEAPTECWTVSGNTSDAYYWRNDYTTNEELMYAFGYAAYETAPSGSRFLFFGADNNEEVFFSRLVSPVLDLSGLANPYLKFTHIQAAWGSDRDTLGVYFRTSSSGDWQYLASFSTSIESWTVDSVALPTSGNTSVEIAFLGAASYGYGIGLDEVTVYDAVFGPDPCEVPTNVQVSHVENHAITVTWDANADLVGWNVRYRKANSGSWSSASTATHSYTITGLEDSTAYEIQVQADCGVNQSDWSASVTATTTNVGIADHLAGSVVLFPNPANDFVNVQCTMYNAQVSADLHLFDVYGKLVQTVPMTGETTSVNISALADGIYFVRVNTGQGVVTKPFVVKR